MPDDDEFQRSPDGLPERLRALPLLSPPDASWQRLSRTLHERQRRPARYARYTGFAIAAAALLALVPLLRAPERVAAPQAPVAQAALPAPADPNARLIAANRSWEARVDASRLHSGALDGDAAAASAELEDLLGLVDTRLAAGDTPERTTLLWQRRLSLLQALDQIQIRGTLAAPEPGGGGVYLASY